MTTWTFKIVAVLVACGLLGACDGQVNLQTKKAPTRQALMARGAVALVAPQGYCVDPSNLRASFALMARCDVLGSVEGTDGAPLGVIAVSLTPPPVSGTLPSAEQITTTKGLAPPERVKEGPDHILFRTSGPAPIEGMDPVHWRGAALVGGHVMGIAYFGPTGGRAMTDEGAMILKQLIGRTIASTDAQ